MITFRPYAEIGPERWDRIVLESPDGWAYCTSHWRRLILDVTQWGLEDFSFAACEGDRIVGVMPLQYQASSQRMASTGWGAGGAVVAADVPGEARAGVAGALIDRAQASARATGALTLEITLSPLRRAALDARSEVNPLVAFGFEDLSTQSLVAELRQPEEALWMALSSNARQMVKKAERAGYRVEGGGWTRHADAYYRVHSETYHRTGVPPHPRRYFDGIAQHMAPAGFAELWVGLSPDGSPVAFHNDTRFNGASVYHTGCSETAHLDSGVNYLLFWAAMRGARAAGCDWYEIGEVFPSARDGKSRGLTVFKSKFGGELHRYLRGRLAMGPAVAVETSAAPESTLAVPAGPPSTDDAIRAAYREGTVYDTSKICRTVATDASEYADRLLQERFAMVSEHYAGGRIVDLCCATGSHLLEMAGVVEQGIGIDFSERYLVKAAQQSAAGGRHVSFVQADARHVPLASSSIDLLYCFSALYAIPGAADVVAEIGRLLKTGGRAVLDFGNRRSLNVYCLRYYTEWPPIQALTLAEIHDALARAGLEVERHRRFQLLPLWAGKPSWLWPMLHPFWKSVFKRRVGGKMIDEWVSSLPILRAFAFRHVMVCRKVSHEGGSR